MSNESVVKWGKLLLLYGLIFLMLVEWLRPVIELTDTGHLALLLLFIVICLATNIIKINSILSVAIKIVYILWFMLYIQDPREGTLLNSLSNGLKALLTGDWYNINDTIKTVLFLVLLWMTIYLIHHWLTIRRSIMYFFIMTIIFLALVDTFTTYNAEMSIVRTMILGLLLTGLLFTEKLISENGMRANVANYAKLLVPLVILIALSALFAYSMPKKEASENLPEPINDIVQWANSSMGAKGKIGYVEDDHQLGGDFEKDDTPVLQYTSETPQYMRIESKSLYTGRGWERPKGDIFVNTFKYRQDVKTSIPKGRKKDITTMAITMDKKYNFLVQPYGIEKVLHSNEKKNKFYIEVDSGKIRAMQGKEQLSLLNYSYEYSPPLYEESKLNASRVNQIRSEEVLTDEEKAMYLQVPKSLPDRVGALAEEITKDEKSVNDKANAVVDYFKTAGYEYSRLNVGYPKGKEDYVDRFLFDTKIGYCDNFSSSMVIMMRTLGIPTRWVKGFAPGERIVSAGESSNEEKYSVTNNNAHSWVEVYVPKVGWMPFEPTIGFEGFEQLEEEKASDTAPKTEEVKKEKEEKKKQEEQKAQNEKEEKIQEEQLKKEKEAQKQPDQKENGKASIAWLWWTLAGIALLVIAILFSQRRKIIPSILIWYYNKKNPSLSKAYEKVVKRLDQQLGLKREDGETLHEFALRVDNYLNTNDFSTLTSYMEQELYNPDAELTKWIDFKECWENLINQTRG